MFIVGVIILVVIYFSLPLPIQIILLVVNFFIPDPVPVLDEVIMCVSMANKLKLITRIYNVCEKSTV